MEKASHFKKVQEVQLRSLLPYVAIDLMTETL